MSELFSQYPLVQKAYKEQERIAGFMGDSVPEALTNLISRCVEIVENYVDRPAAEKEGIMVGCVLLTASPFTFDDIRRFETDYTPQVKAIVDILLSGNDEKVKGSVDFISAANVVSVAMGEHLLADIKKEKLPKGLTPATLKATLEQGAEAQKEFAAIVERVAPRLFTLLNETEKNILTALDNFDAAPARPRHPKKKGPQPK